MKKKRLSHSYNQARSRGSRVVGARKNRLFNISLKKAVVYCAVIVAIVLCTKVYLMQRSELLALKEQKSVLENEITTIQEDILHLQQEASKLDDPDYIEVVARQEYGMVGKDDIVFVSARGVVE